MNQKIAGAGVLSLLLTAMTVMAITTGPAAPSLREAEELAGSQPVSVDLRMFEEEQGEQSYILKDIDGVVTILCPGQLDFSPVVTDIYVAELRTYDQELLAEGIEARGAESLTKLLEDFGS